MAARLVRHERMPMSGADPLERVKDAYAWFSQVGRRELALERDAMARYFTDDVIMKVDYAVKAKGFDGLYARFEEMLATTVRWEAEMVDSMLTDGVRAAAYCQFRFVDVAGQRGIVHTCSIWTMRGSRIAAITEVASFEAARLDLGDH